jgi:hypothetical protein
MGDYSHGTGLDVSVTTEILAHREQKYVEISDTNKRNSPTAAVAHSENSLYMIYNNQNFNYYM